MGHAGGTRRDLERFAGDVLAKVLTLKRSCLWQGYYQTHFYYVQIAVGWKRKMQECVVPCPSSRRGCPSNRRKERHLGARALVFKCFVFLKISTESHLIRKWSFRRTEKLFTLSGQTQLLIFARKKPPDFSFFFFPFF